MKKQPTFLTIRTKNRKKILDLNHNKFYFTKNTMIIDNQTKGTFDTENVVLRKVGFFRRLLLIFKMLFAKNFIFSIIK